MVCDFSKLHIDYISAADQFSVFVHAERLNKMKMNFSLSVHTKTDNWPAADMLPISSVETSQIICYKVTELAY